MKKTNNFIKELVKRDIDPFLAGCADRIRCQMDIVNYHDVNRRLLMFYCVYAACNEHEIQVDLFELRRKFNISYQQSNKCISKFSSEKTGYISPKPKNILENQMIKLCKSLSIEYENCVEILNRSLTLDPSLQELSPQSLCGGVLLFCINLFEYKIKPNEVCEKVNLKINTLNKTKNRILKLIND